VCAACRDKIEAMFHQCSPLGRGIKAIVFGTIGAALGAILYYAIMQITGWNIGLVAVVVGLMVGGAVRAGSGNRGGLFYQLIAVFLTYSAIAAMFAVPVAIEAIQRREQRAGDVQIVNAEGKPAPAKPGAQREPDDEDPAAPAEPAPQPPRVAQEPRLNPGRNLVVVAVITAIMISITYTIPVQIAMDSPLSGFIFGFALWEDWKINRRVQLAFNGPFRLGAADGDEPTSKPGEAVDES
jgi:hypothetical protein